MGITFKVTVCISQTVKVKQTTTNLAVLIVLLSLQILACHRDIAIILHIFLQQQENISFNSARVDDW